MNKRIANTVRTAFALLMLGLSLYAGAESVLANPAGGLSTRCGSADQPCALAPLTVSTVRPSSRMVSATAADAGGTHALPHAAAES